MDSLDFSLFLVNFFHDSTSHLLEEADGLLDLLGDLLGGVNDLELVALLVIAFSNETADDTTTNLRGGFSAEDPFVANIGLLNVRFLRLKELVGSETILIVAPLDLNLGLGGVGELDMDALELRLLGFLDFLPN